MSALAIAFDKADYKVTGSDAGFFPPVSTNLEKQRVKFYPGWHPDKMCADGEPDLVIVGNVASSTNPEWLYVQEHKLNYLSYPEAIAKYFVQPNSIVCAGTYGKTTTSTLLAWILTQAGYDPSYMFGGLAVNEGFDSARIDNSDWSILEGDEYKSSRWDNKAKFFHYSPTHLLLTAVQWDHADVYPTELSYFEAFKKLVSSIPKNGLAVLSENIDKKIVKLLNCQTVKYGKDEKNNYKYTDIKQTKDGLKFNIIHNSNSYNLISPMLGDYMAENITACFAMAHQIGIEPEKIIKAIAEFEGIKRRLEKKYEGKITVFDDIAHSPAKAKFTLQTLKEVYKTTSNTPKPPPPPLQSFGGHGNPLLEKEGGPNKIFAIFEPNTGNRRSQSAEGYNNVFIDADEVIIPKLTKIKVDSNDQDKPFDGKKLTEIISKTHKSTKYIENDQDLLNYLKTKTQHGDVVVFLGSHGFRGMIDSVIARSETQ